MTALQEDWDEEQDPEFFKLGGSVPQATNKTSDEAGTLSAFGSRPMRALLVVLYGLSSCPDSSGSL